MADRPFGFTPGDGGDPDDPDRGDGDPPLDPFAAMLAGLGGGTPGGNPFAALGGGAGAANPFSALGGTDIAAALRQLADLMSWQGGPVNWDLAGQVAQQTVGDDPPVSAADRAAVDAALRLADLWLDAVTSLPSGVVQAEAWTRAEWVTTTLPVWRQLADPVAERVVGAMGASVPEEVRAVAGPLLGMMTQLGGMVFGTQLGQAVGRLATEVVGGADVGVPLAPAGRAALLPAGVAAFGAGLGVDAEQVRLHLALREAAHARLFGHVPWLRSALLGAIDAFARGISIDTEAVERAMGEVDPSDPESLQRALQGGLLEPVQTEEQKAALTRLETLLALVEGWVDEVAAAAAAGHLPAAAALRETSRRRRASGGPAEQAFRDLVGLELRPRRLREAARLWAVVAEQRGPDGRDAVWGHPDLLPGPEGLDDPEAWAASAHGATGAGPDGDLDAELRRLGDDAAAPGDSGTEPGDGGTEPGDEGTAPGGPATA